ncbi:hypothetical protein Tco_1075660, partial [Tanacetum coccineum]
GVGISIILEVTTFISGSDCFKGSSANEVGITKGGDVELSSPLELENKRVKIGDGIVRNGQLSDEWGVLVVLNMTWQIDHV